MRTRRRLGIKSPGARGWHVGKLRGAIRLGVAVTPAAAGGSARRRGVVGWQVANTLHLGCRIDADIARPPTISATLLPHKAIHRHTKQYEERAPMSHVHRRSPPPKRGQPMLTKATPTHINVTTLHAKAHQSKPSLHQRSPTLINAKARPTDVHRGKTRDDEVSQGPLPCSRREANATHHC